MGLSDGEEGEYGDEGDSDDEGGPEEQKKEEINIDDI